MVIFGVSYVVLHIEFHCSLVLSEKSEFLLFETILNLLNCDQVYMDKNLFERHSSFITLKFYMQYILMNGDGHMIDGFFGVN